MSVHRKARALMCCCPAATNAATASIGESAVDAAAALAAVADIAAWGTNEGPKGRRSKNKSAIDMMAATSARSEMRLPQQLLLKQQQRDNSRLLLHQQGTALTPQPPTVLLLLQVQVAAAAAAARNNDCNN